MALDPVNQFRYALQQTAGEYFNLNQAVVYQMEAIEENNGWTKVTFFVKELKAFPEK